MMPNQVENNGAQRRLLKSLWVQNFLSFAPDFEKLELGGLNVLIGANGSGKSNLIEAIAFLRAAPRDLHEVVRQGGGAAEWIWKGRPSGIAEVTACVEYADSDQGLIHTIQFRANEYSFELRNEFVGTDAKSPVYFYQFDEDSPRIGIKNADDHIDWIPRAAVNPNESILSQRKDPLNYPEITYLANAYPKIAIYREWVFGEHAPCRDHQPADMRADRLNEDFSNLGLFLNRIRQNPKAKRAVLDALHELYIEFDDFDVSIHAGTVQVFFTEGNFNIPARRLSDGTLRYLCLIAILCDPTPPPLICIEEPELGLHPDILPSLAKHLIDASTRTQLIVTTHSDILVDAMSDRPEAVVVCEKHEGATTCRRLKADELSEWLEKYRLGELWTKGELGGTRW